MLLMTSFISALRPELHDKMDQTDVQEWLATRWRAACAAWPQLQVPVETFAAFVAERIPAEASAESVMSSLRVEELLLTCACARGDEQAIRLLEIHYFPLVLSALARMRLDPSKVDEVKQTLRRHLLVSEDGQPPRICNYAGRGDLGSWLSVSAVRAAYKLLRKEKRGVNAEDDRLSELAMPDADIELKYTKENCRDLFRDSLRQAIASLADREKNLLRQHYLDGLTIDQVGALYHTHRATAARWMASARQKLLDRTRSVLMERLRAPLAECESIIRMAQSQAEMSFYNLLSPLQNGE
jgi:RNA polymerase sigma-70 factor (ECF subfamily)